METKKIEDRKVERLLLDAWPPKIKIQEHRRTTDIILKLPASFQGLPAAYRNAYSSLGVGFPHIFEEVLWRKPRLAGQRTLHSQLASLGYSVYREAWFHLLRLLYLRHFHPVANAKLEKRIAQLRKWLGREAGRRTQSPAEKASVLRRYRELLPICKMLHRAAHLTAEEFKTINNAESRRRQIRKKIWELVWRKVYGRREDDAIFGGKAFKRIKPQRERMTAPRALADPQSWEPYQLAIAVLSIERDLEYQTLVKAIQPTKRR